MPIKAIKKKLIKTEWCKPLRESGYCRYGHLCKYAHNENELRWRDPNPLHKTKRCENFHEFGLCPYGTRCVFQHDGPASSNLPAPDYQKTAFVLYNQAIWYFKHRKYDNAELLYKSALTNQVKFSGEVHIYTVDMLQSLAQLYTKTNRYNKAEPLYKRALEINVSLLGPEHMETTFSKIRLAACYLCHDTYSKAKKAIGQAHKNTAFSLMYQARICEAHCNHREAELSYKWALAVFENFMWSEDLNIIETLNGLGWHNVTTNRHGEVEPAYKRNQNMLLSNYPW